MITLSEQQLERVLVGSEVVVTVGEPWDFTSPDGEGVLLGRIVQVAHGDPAYTRTQRVRLAVTPFDAEGGHTVEYLTAHRRYADSTGIIEQLASGEDVDVNLSYEDQVSSQSLPEGVSPFLIGGIILAQWLEEPHREVGVPTEQDGG